MLDGGLRCCWQPAAIVLNNISDLIGDLLVIDLGANNSIAIDVVVAR